MSWVLPDDSRDPKGLTRWIHLVVGYAALAVAILVATFAQRPEHPAFAFGLTGLAAAWLALIVPLYPVRARRPVAVVGFFSGLVVLIGTLLSESEAFTWFAWIGYPYAFLLFSARWTVFAVAATALASVVPRSQLFTQVGMGAGYAVVLGTVIPVIIAGWVAGSESEKRRKSNVELAESNRKLAAALEENAGLHAQLLTQAREAGVADERSRLAREIHDTLAQGLTGIVTQLQAAQRVREDPAVWPEHVAKAHALAKESLTEARRSVRELRPGPLADSPLPGALRELAAKWSQRSAVPATVEVTGEPRPLATGIEVTLFRAAQEALANVAKHAGATRVGLTLCYAGEVVLLDVRDDGAGFDPALPYSTVDGGFGLNGMRQRVLGVGGSLAVESAPGEGTAISVNVPAIPAEDGT
jgi:signal transduction histidine kinase